MSAKTSDRQLSPREQEIAKIRKIDRDKRSEQQIARLAELLAEDRRDRWNRLSPGRKLKMARAIKGLLAISSPQSYQYTAEEAQAICDEMDRKCKEIRAAFLGTVREKGMFDV